MAATRRRDTAAYDMLPAIRAGYAKGTPVADIAKQIGVSRNVVIGKAWRAGLKHPHPNGKGRRVHSGRDIAISRCVINGIPISAMAAIHDLSYEGLIRVVRTHCRCVRKGNPYQPSIWRWRDEQSSAGA